MPPAECAQPVRKDSRRWEYSALNEAAELCLVRARESFRTSGVGARESLGKRESHGDHPHESWEAREWNQKRNGREFEAQPTQFANGRERQPEDRNPSRHEAVEEHRNGEAGHEQPNRNRISRTAQAEAQVVKSQRQRTVLGNARLDD